MLILSRASFCAIATERNVLCTVGTGKTSHPRPCQRVKKTKETTKHRDTPLYRGLVIYGSANPQAATSSPADPPSLYPQLWIAPFICPALVVLSVLSYSQALEQPLHGVPEVLACAAVPLFLHGAVPAIDILLGPCAPRPTSALKRDDAPQRFAPRQAAFFYNLLYVATSAWAYTAITAAPVRPLHLGLTLLSLMVTGAVGTAASHELIHAKNLALNLGGELHLAWSWFWPYTRAHMHHHLHVGTPEDHASTSPNETVWQFFPKYLGGAYAKAWSMEAAECARAGHSLWSPHNRMLWGLTAQLTITASVCSVLGPFGMLMHIGTGLGAILYLAIFDYCLHYGLYREKQPDGRYEPVTAHSSWNSFYPFENALLFNVIYHSDHHQVASKPGAMLGCPRGAPAFPAPASLVTLAALVPPLWRHLMDERAASANAEHKRTLA